MSATRADTPRATLRSLVVGRGRVGGAVAPGGRGARASTSPGGPRRPRRARRADADVALLCVPDAEIAAACAAVVAAAPELRFVGHTSGATGARRARGRRATPAPRLLAPPAADDPRRRAPTWSAPRRRSPAPATRRWRSPATSPSALGMTPFEVPEESRAAYHAAAAIASNFLVALESSAVELLEAAGVADATRPASCSRRSSCARAANWAERGARGADRPDRPRRRGDGRAPPRGDRRASRPSCSPLYEALAERTRADRRAARRCGA